MLGIIYKFTIVAKLKMDGHQPFYVGQHCNAKSVEQFLNFNYYYIGSGTIWNSFLDKLKEINPDNWRYLIKREVLFSSENISQKALSVVEEKFIEKEKAHYSYKLGGCNYLKDSHVDYSFFKDTTLRERISEACKKADNPGSFKRGHKHSEQTLKKISKTLTGRHLSEELIEKFRIINKGENNPNYGNKWNEEQRKHLSDIKTGVKKSDEVRHNMSEGKKKYYKTHKHHSKGRIHITDGINNKTILPDEAIPEGWRRGRTINVTEETRKRISEARKNSKGKRKHSEETKRKMSVSAKKLNRSGDNSHFKGMFLITNGIENSRAKSIEDVPEGWFLWTS